MNFDAHEIVPRLWMGSAPPFGRTLSRSGFNVLVLCAIEHQPSSGNFPNVDVAYIDLDDDGNPIPREAFDKAIHLSRHLAHEIYRGKNVIVTCQQGRNRSGFITALTLMRLSGCDGRTAAKIVQARRASPFGPALTNRQFVAALRCISPAPRRGNLMAVANHDSVV